MIAPSKYYNQYMNLKVPLGKLSIASVYVKDYQNCGQTWKVKTKGFETQCGPLQEKFGTYKSGKATGAIDGLVPPADFQSRDIPYVFMGCGSPAQISAVLQMVAHFQTYKDVYKGSDVKYGLQTYINKYIGLNCNGFVGSYAHELGTGKSPDTYILNYAPQAKRRRRLEDVQPSDVMVWPSGGHIALIDSVVLKTGLKYDSSSPPKASGDKYSHPYAGVYTGTTFRVVESSLDGLYHGLTDSIYTFVKVEDDVFTVRRGLPPFVEKKVYIASIWV